MNHLDELVEFFLANQGRNIAVRNEPIEPKGWLPKYPEAEVKLTSSKFLPFEENLVYVVQVGDPKVTYYIVEEAWKDESMGPDNENEVIVHSEGLDAYDYSASIYGKIYAPYYVVDSSLLRAAMEAVNSGGVLLRRSNTAGWLKQNSDKAHEAFYNRVEKTLEYGETSGLVFYVDNSGPVKFALSNPAKTGLHSTKFGQWLKDSGLQASKGETTKLVSSGDHIHELGIVMSYGGWPGQGTPDFYIGPSNKLEAKGWNVINIPVIEYDNGDHLIEAFDAFILEVLSG